MIRNWPEYNRKLIKRGEFLINLRFLDSWNEEIEQMNANKVGQPYFYPDSMIEFAAYFHCRGFAYRSCQGILEGLSNICKYKFPVISYTQICRRVNKLNINFESVEESMVVAIDGTGEKVSNRGEWIRDKWKIRRGWIKVVILGTPDGKVIDVRIGPETLDERKAGRGMIRANHKKIKKVIADGYHDCRKTFNLCKKFKIETAIKIRKNASTRSRGSPYRREEVLKYKRLGHRQWVKEKDYGVRWLASEGIFSAKKRIFGETVRAKKKRNMYHEIKLKYWFYNKLKEIK